MSIALVYKRNKETFQFCDTTLAAWPTQTPPKKGFVGMVTLQSPEAEEMFDIYVEETQEDGRTPWTTDIYPEEKLVMMLLDAKMKHFSLRIVTDANENMSKVLLNDQPMELVSCFDEDKKDCHRVEERNVCHRAGYWHESAHIWLLKENMILLQKRSMNKTAYPGYYDTSTAGHVLVGESVEACALRELNEELGLTVDASQLIPIGEYRIESDQNFYGKKYLEREFCSVYVVEDFDESSMKLQSDEVDSVTWMDVDQALEGVMDTEDTYCIDAQEFEFLYAYLEQKEGKDGE